MIPVSAAIELTARAINDAQSREGWDQPPALITLFCADVPPIEGMRAGVITGVPWPIPPALFMLDPVLVLQQLGTELVSKKFFGKESAPVKYAKRCAGPTFAGIAFVVEAYVTLVGETEKRDQRSVFIADCAGRLTILSHIDGRGPVIYPMAEFLERTEMDADIAGALRDLVIGVLRHCPPGTADIDEVQKMGVTV